MLVDMGGPQVIKSGGVKHGMHALITVFTCGLWAPVWFLVWVLTPKKTKTVVPPPYPYPPQ